MPVHGMYEFIHIIAAFLNLCCIFITMKYFLLLSITCLIACANAKKENKTGISLDDAVRQANERFVNPMGTGRIDSFEIVSVDTISEQAFVNYSIDILERDVSRIATDIKSHSENVLFYRSEMKDYGEDYQENKKESEYAEHIRDSLIKALPISEQKLEGYKTQLAKNVNTEKFGYLVRTKSVLKSKTRWEMKPTYLVDNNMVAIPYYKKQ